MRIYFIKPTFTLDHYWDYPTWGRPEPEEELWDPDWGGGGDDQARSPAPAQERLQPQHQQHHRQHQQAKQQ